MDGINLKTRFACNKCKNQLLTCLSPRFDACRNVSTVKEVVSCQREAYSADKKTWCQRAVLLSCNPSHTMVQSFLNILNIVIIQLWNMSPVTGHALVTLRYGHCHRCGAQQSEVFSMDMAAF